MIMSSSSSSSSSLVAQNNKKTLPPSSSPSLFGSFRFWLTCCLISFMHHAFYYSIYISSQGNPEVNHNENHQYRFLRSTDHDRSVDATLPMMNDHHHPSSPAALVHSPPDDAAAAATTTTTTDLTTTTTTTTTTSKSSSSSSEEEAKYWKDNGCIYVENLCHSTYRFFYDTPDDHNDYTSSGQRLFPEGHDSTPWQPNLELNFEKDVLPHAYPTRIVVGRGKPIEMITMQQQQQQQQQRRSTRGQQQQHAAKCLQSPISHHLIYSTPYNDMMVEWYIRTMTGFKEILFPKRNEPSPPFFPKQSQLQLYVLLYNQAKILDGHQLFTNTLPTTHTLLPFQALMDTTKCTCLPKTIFCGFQNTTQTTTTSTTTTTTTPVVTGAATSDAVDTAAQPGISIDQDDNVDKTSSNISKNETEMMTTTTTNITTSVLKPFADLFFSGIYREKRRYPGIRKLVRQELFDGSNGGLVQSMVQDYRFKQIRQHYFPSNEKSDDVINIDEYIIIGLAQRSGRRKWSNLSSILNTCNNDAKLKQFKILCIEVNMDKTSSHVLQQAVIHGSLQALIGIHGSHFVNAVMMPKGATILELLPWFPNWQRFGREWARRTDINTPIGNMFFNSDLIHVGYALERSSAPQLCVNNNNITMGSVQDDECLYQLRKGNRDAIWWGTRDFTIPWTLVQTFIEQFMLPAPLKPDLCQDYLNIQRNPLEIQEEQQQQRPQPFALYNVNCRDKVTSTRYHTMHSYTNYTKEEEAQLKILIAEGRDKPPSQWKQQQQKIVN